MNIFNKIEKENKHALLNCLMAVKKTYLKDEIIFDTTSEIKAVGHVSKGSVRLIKNDFDGNKIIISDIKKDETFAEAIVCSGTTNSDISAYAVENNTEIIFLDFKRILSVCHNSCPFHKKLIENIIKIISVKTLFLQKRLELLSHKNIRKRIIFFLNSCQKDTDKIFEIPYSREEMADYLCVDRSALSRELSNMKKDGIIDFHKNSFKLLNFK